MSRRRRPDVFKFFCIGFTLLWGVILLYPVLYIISLSLRRSEELNIARFGVLPKHVRWTNYSDAFSLMSTYVVSIPKLMLNSTIVTGSAVLATLTAALLASYAFARLRFRGRRPLFYTLLLGLIVPVPVMLIPEFITIREYGLIGSRLSLILPYIAFGLPLPILILTAFIKRLPNEVFEAARLDGASHFRMLKRIVVPLSLPAIATCSIFLVLIYWNEFPLALVLIQNPDLTTVPLALGSVQGKGFTPWEQIAAVMLITSLPVVLLFIAFQRQYTEGLVSGALKE